MADLTSLLTQPTVEQLTQQVASLLSTARWPMTAWQPGSVLRTMVSVLMRPISDLAQSIVLIAKGGYLDTAKGEWLTLLASSLYETDRWTAQRCEITVSVYNPSGSDQPYAAGALVVGNASDYTFSNESVFTATAGTSTQTTFVAFSTGSAYNSVASAISVIKSGGIAGMTVTSIVDSSYVPGSDDESDDALRLRCRKKWSTLASCATQASLEYYATSIGPSITRAYAVADAQTGDVTVYCAGPPGSETPDIADLSAVETVLNGLKRPICASVTVDSANVSYVPLTAKIYVKKELQAKAEPQCLANLTAYLYSLPIGGTIEMTKVIGCFTGVSGVTKALFYTVGTPPTLITQDQTYTPASGAILSIDQSSTTLAFYSV